MIARAREQYEQRAQNEMLGDPLSFWNYIKSKKGSRVPQKILKNGDLLTAEQSATELANYFHSVYSAERPRLNICEAIVAAGGDNGAARVHLGKLTLEEVKKSLKQLKPKKCAGPDGIPSYVFKDCRLVLAEPLLYIYNLSLKAADFPKIWKITRVVPVPKGGSGAQVDGYRPVAVLSTPAKVLESAMYTRIYSQVSAQLLDEQHGFRPARSTTSNLLSYISNIVPAVDRGSQTDAAYFDFRKAFDLVDNDVLLVKLASFGFTPHLLQFFASYMQDRQQYVEYRGHKSKPYFTRSGVSQGSNLGPLQFTLMINDLPKVIKNAKCLLFADDLKLYLEVNSEEDCGKLQKDIDRVVRWSKDNFMQFNTAKCAVITFSRSHAPLLYNYNMGGIPMSRITEVRDLGVTLSTELTFRCHIMRCCKKAYRNLGFVLRTVRGFTNTNAIVALYNALVRSQLESNAVIWAPHETKYSLMLERVQNKFVRYLYMRLYGVYPYYPLMYPTLFVLGMVGYNELRVRRELTLITYIFKVIRGKVNNADILAQVRLCVPDRYVERRRRPPLLAVPCGRTNLLKKAPVTRALRTLNLIAERIDIFSCSLSELTTLVMWTICYN